MIRWQVGEDKNGGTEWKAAALHSVQASLGTGFHNNKSRSSLRSLNLKQKPFLQGAFFDQLPSILGRLDRLLVDSGD